MDLAYGPRYEAFREEVRAFVREHGAKAPKGGQTMAGMRGWQ